MNGPRICTQPCNARRHTCCRAAAPHLRPTRKNASRKRRRDVRDNVANGGPLAIGPLAGGEQMVVGLLRLRFAAGVCVLAAGLLMGAGGAIAVADPGASGSAAHGDHEHSTDVRKSRSDEFNSRAPKKPKHEPGATTSGTGANAPGPAAEETEGRARRHHSRNRRHHIGNRRHHSREPAPPHSEPAPPQSEPARPQSELARRLLMWSPRFLVWRRQLRMWSRRYPIWSRQFLTSSR